MNKVFTSLVFTFTFLTSPLYSFNWDELSLPKKVIIGASGVVATAASAFGFYKLCNWAYYYSTDHTPVEVLKVRLEYQLKSVEPFLHDFETYSLTKLTLPLIINRRYPNHSYPTLTYDESLCTLSNNLYYLHQAFERKKSKSNNIEEIESLEDIIQQVAQIRDQINIFKSIVETSNGYTLEYKAKYPAPQPINTIIIYRDAPSTT